MSVLRKGSCSSGSLSSTSTAGTPQRAQRVEDGDAVVGVAAGIQDDAVGPACGRLDLVDEVALVVGLEKFHFHAHLGAAQLEVIQQTVIIQLTGHARLGEVHHVEVGAVND